MGDVLHSVVDLGYARFPWHEQSDWKRWAFGCSLRGRSYRYTSTRPLVTTHESSLHWGRSDGGRLNHLKLLQALRWRTLNLAPTGSPLPSEDCLFLKYVQEHSWCHSIYSWYFSIVAPRSSKKGLPVVVWFHGFVILVIFLQMTALEAS